MIDRMANAVADLHTLVQRVAESNNGQPLVLLGHSRGGAVALSYTIEHQDALDALVLSAPLAALGAASPVTRVAGPLAVGGRCRQHADRRVRGPARRAGGTGRGHAGTRRGRCRR